MKTAIDIAKSEEVAEKLAPHSGFIAVGKRLREKIVTALLEARLDALREYGYCTVNAVGEAIRNLETAISGRKEQGL